MKRSNKLFIGKNTYGCSIGANVKIDFALNKFGLFTKEGLVTAIIKTIFSELGISEQYLEKFSINKNLIAAYRDVVQGGKPQLLFYIQSLWDKEKIDENFKNNMKSKRKSFSTDGKKLVWIHVSKLRQMCILPDRIIANGKKYPMVPAVAASIVMLIEHLENI